MSEMTPPIKKKKRGIKIVLAIFIPVAFIALCIILPLTFGIPETPKATVNVVFDATKYSPKNGKNITEKELIKQLGKPKRIEKWDYKSGNGLTYPMRTLIYKNREYIFNNDNLQRITLYDEFSYSDKNEFLDMFNLKTYANTKINDTNSFYRVYNCGVNDIWLEYGDGKITLTKISYGKIFQ